MWTPAFWLFSGLLHITSERHRHMERYTVFLSRGLWKRLWLTTNFPSGLLLILLNDSFQVLHPARSVPPLEGPSGFEAEAGSNSSVAIYSLVVDYGLWDESLSVAAKKASPVWPWPRPRLRWCGLLASNCPPAILSDRVCAGKSWLLSSILKSFQCLFTVLDHTFVFLLFS